MYIELHHMTILYLAWCVCMGCGGAGVFIRRGEPGLTFSMYALIC